MTGYAIATEYGGGGSSVSVGSISSGSAGGPEEYEYASTMRVSAFKPCSLEYTPRCLFFCPFVAARIRARGAFVTLGSAQVQSSRETASLRSEVINDG